MQILHDITTERSHQYLSEKNLYLSSNFPSKYDFRSDEDDKHSRPFLVNDMQTSHPPLKSDHIYMKNLHVLIRMKNLLSDFCNFYFLSYGYKIKMTITRKIKS